MQRGNDGAIRERQSPVAESLERNIVAQFGAQLLEFVLCSRQPLDRDQAPVTIPVGDFDAIDRRRVSIGLSGRGPDIGGDTGDCGTGSRNCNQRYLSHSILLARSRHAAPYLHSGARTRASPESIATMW